MSLIANDLSKSFGGVVAVRAISLEVRPGEIVGLAGPNGAGKTTLLNLLTGIDAPDTGRIYLGGRDITRLHASTRIRAGLGRTFQTVQLPGQMSVLDNIMLGFEKSRKESLVRVLARTPRQRREERELREGAAALAESVHLGDVLTRQTSELPYGAQRLVELARALATKPSTLLLDEPGAGLGPAEIELLSEILTGLAATNMCGMLLVEHNVPFIQAVSDRAVVMSAGSELAAGTPQAVFADPRVIEAYLGGATQQSRGAIEDV